MAPTKPNAPGQRGEAAGRMSRAGNLAGSDSTTNGPARLDLARQELRHLLDGGAPSDRPLTDFGDWREVVDALRDAHARGGLEAVKAAWNTVAGDDHALIALVAGDSNLPLLARTWKLQTLQDAYEPRPPLDYLVQGLLTCPSLNIIYGPPGSLKTMLMLELALCVAAGVPWLGPLPDSSGQPRTVRQAPALIIDCDNGSRRTADRLEALARARNLPADIPLHWVSMPSPWLDLSDEGNADQLMELITHLGAGFVVVDNLGVVSGDADENSGDMARVMGNSRRVAEATHACTNLIHHQRKSSVMAGRKGDGLRGHSSIEAALDLALLVEREELSDSITVTATKTRGADVLPFGALWTYTHKPGTDDLATARFYGYQLEDTKSDHAIDNAIRSALVGRMHNKTGLTEAVKSELSEVGVNRIRGRIDYLASTGELTTTAGDRTEKLYTLRKH